MLLPGNRAARVWLGLVLVYLLFFFWYTSFGGPLTSEEISHFSRVVEQNVGDDPERTAVWKQFMETDTGDDFGMISVLDLKETPAPVQQIEPGESSEEVLARYTEPFFGQAIRSAAHPVLAGSAATSAIDIWGIEGATDWSEGAVVRWRSRRDFMQFLESMREDSSHSSIHDFKIAALEKTIAYPLDPWFHFGDPRIVLALGFAVIGLAVQAFSRRGR
ncbi:hypothetical protein MK489_22560 [Myxococcota bacterium]|nr:hypothetical protein [Myxococcota bacterium]